MSTLVPMVLQVPGQVSLLVIGENRNVKVPATGKVLIGEMTCILTGEGTGDAACFSILTCVLTGEGTMTDFTVDGDAIRFSS